MLQAPALSQVSAFEQASAAALQPGPATPPGESPQTPPVHCSHTPSPQGPPLGVSFARQAPIPLQVSAPEQVAAGVIQPGPDMFAGVLMHTPVALHWLQIPSPHPVPSERLAALCTQPPAPSQRA